MHVDEQADEPATRSVTAPDATAAVTAEPAATQELALVSDARDEVCSSVHLSLHPLMHVDEQAAEPASLTADPTPDSTAAVTEAPEPEPIPACEARREVCSLVHVCSAWPSTDARTRPGGRACDRAAS